MMFRGSAPSPGLPPMELARRALNADDLATAVRCQQAIDLVARALNEQSELDGGDRNEPLYDLCLDLLNILRPPALRPSVPVIPGRS